MESRKSSRSKTTTCRYIDAVSKLEHTKLRCEKRSYDEIYSYETDLALAISMEEPEPKRIRVAKRTLQAPMPPKLDLRPYLPSVATCIDGRISVTKGCCTRVILTDEEEVVASSTIDVASQILMGLREGAWSFCEEEENCSESDTDAEDTISEEIETEEEREEVEDEEHTSPHMFDVWIQSDLQTKSDPMPTTPSPSSPTHPMETVSYEMNLESPLDDETKQTPLDDLPTPESPCKTTPRPTATNLMEGLMFIESPVDSKLDFSEHDVYSSRLARLINDEEERPSHSIDDRTVLFHVSLWNALASVGYTPRFKGTTESQIACDLSMSVCPAASPCTACIKTVSKDNNNSSNSPAPPKRRCHLIPQQIWTNVKREVSLAAARLDLWPGTRLSKAEMEFMVLEVLSRLSYFSLSTKTLRNSRMILTVPTPKDKHVLKVKGTNDGMAHLSNNDMFARYKNTCY